MSRNTTVNVKAARSVLVQTTGAEKQRGTVMMAVIADGCKLPPYVIFKRKTMPKDKVPNGILVRFASKTRVVCPLSGLGLAHHRSLLVLDSFRGHLMASVREKLEELRMDLAAIPGGLTSVLQPLDVSKPFKDSVRRLYSEGMADGNHELTLGYKIKRPSIEQLCKGIKTAGDEIPAAVVVKSSKKTGISNALDGTEDDAFGNDVDDFDIAMATDDDDSGCSKVSE